MVSQYQVTIPRPSSANTRSRRSTCATHEILTIHVNRYSVSMGRLSDVVKRFLASEVAGQLWEGVGREGAFRGGGLSRRTHVARGPQRGDLRET
jgi:hypothetical protein